MADISIASATSAAQVAELADATTLALSEDDLTRFEQIGG
jgi:aryl-alcohol dehydrogenase-like predicted oxidoreductase